MSTKPNTLLLTLNIFDSAGGIQTVCRTLCYTLSNLQDHNLEIHSLHDSEPDRRYVQQTKFKGYCGRKLSFLWNSVISGFKNETIILSHINLIGIALVIRFFSSSAKFIMLAHGTEVWRTIPRWKRYFIQKHIHVWAVSNYTKEILKTKHDIKQQVEVVHNCLDPFFRVPESFERPQYLLDRYTLTPDQPILLTLCRINRYERKKGYEQVIGIMPELLKQTPDIKYLLCGEVSPTEIKRLQRLIKVLNLQEHVILTGKIPEQELSDHYLMSSCFLLPSQKEGFGLVIIEAVACGCQVICTNTGGSPEASLHGKLAKNINALSTGDLYTAISDHLKQPLNKQEKTKYQRLCQDNFGHKNYSNKIRRLLTTMITP